MADENQEESHTNKRKEAKKYKLKRLNKRKFFSYSDDALKKSVIEIRENNMSVREASRKFGVPRSTIQDRLKGRTSENNERKTGPPPIMTVDGERKIAKWIIDTAKCGFPIKKSNLFYTVTKIAKDLGKLHLFKNQEPGRKWYDGFMKRHPEISAREAESINKARALVTEEFIRKWFRDFQVYAEENSLLEVLNDPRRVFNGDEAGFCLCPKTGKVLAPKGWKNVYSVSSGNEKENITVLLMFNADGKICTPFVVFPYIRPPRALVESMPPTWVLGKSEKGWMTRDAFYEYMSNYFNKWLIDEKISKPVVVFIDGHKSHMSLPLSEFCDANGIVLYALPPNTTHLLQPADVSVFRPMKQEWKTTVRRWQSRPENINCSITKLNFCNIFEETLQGSGTPIQIKNGFRKCGLFPLEPNNVDYTKCVKNILENKFKKTSDGKIKETDITANDLDISEKVIKKLEPNLYSYGINVEVIYNEINEMRAEQQHVTIDSTVSLNESPIFPIQGVFGNDNIQENHILQDLLQNLDETDPQDSIMIAEFEVSDDINADNILVENIIETRKGLFGNENMDKDSDICGIKDNEQVCENEEKQKMTCRLKNTETSIETVKDNSVIKQTTIVQVQDGKSVMKDDELTNNEKEKGDLNRNKDMGELNNNDGENKLAGKKDIEEYNKVTEEIKDCEELRKDKNEKNMLQKNVDPFEAHLHFPIPITRKSDRTTKVKLPSAISSQAWRNHYLKEEQKKKDKIEQIKLRKEQRETKKRQTETNGKKVAPKKKSKKQTINDKENINSTDSPKEKIKCTLCEEDLISDTEDDLEKNIGCDYCINWYHLKCTDLFDLTYEDAASKTYKCDLCK